MKSDVTDPGIKREGETDPPDPKNSHGTRKTGTLGEETIVFDPFVPEIHYATDGTHYQSVRSCDLELIRDK